MGRSRHDLPYRNRTSRNHQDREDKRLLHRLERRMGRQFLDEIVPEEEAPEAPPSRGSLDHGALAPWEDKLRRSPVQRKS